MCEIHGDPAPLFAALAKAQAEMGPAHKGAKNPHFRSRYADLKAVMEAVLPPLNRHGLSLLQALGEMDGGKVAITTILTHESGAYLSAVATLPKGRGDGPQAAGAGISYLRRYAAQALLSLPAADDDGESAEGRGRRQARSQRQPAPPAPPREAPAPPGEHHPSFEAERVAFMAELSGQGFTYDEVCDIVAIKGRPRPSAMTSKQRAALVGWLSELSHDDREGFAAEADAIRREGREER